MKEVIPTSNGAGSLFVVESRSIDETVFVCTYLHCFVIEYLAVKIPVLFDFMNSVH